MVSSILELCANTVKAIIEQVSPPSRAGYVIYILEKLDAQLENDDTNDLLEYVQKAIAYRLKTGRW